MKTKILKDLKSEHSQNHLKCQTMIRTRNVQLFHTVIHLKNQAATQEQVNVLKITIELQVENLIEPEIEL